MKTNAINDSEMEPTLMKAAVYSSSSPYGVEVVDRYYPTIKTYPFAESKKSIIALLFQYVWKVAVSVLMHPPKKFVICEVKCAAVNPVDAKWLYGDKVPQPFFPLVKKIFNGRICGIDFAGVVVEAPDGCGFSVGDEVFGSIPPTEMVAGEGGGSFAEAVRCPTDCIHFKPENMSWEAASAVPLVGLTVLQAFRDAKLQAGQHVCIVGASGGTGHVAVQLAKAMGARVTAICGHRNFDFVAQLGADSIIAYDSNNDLNKNDDEGDDVDGDGNDFMVKKLGQVCEEHGAFDVVFDTVTSHDSRDRNFNYEHRMKSTTTTTTTTTTTSSTQPTSQVRLLHPWSTYICLGGDTVDWFLAHLKRFLGVDLFPRGHMLFWVRLAGSGGVCGGDLSTLKAFCEQRHLAVHVNSIHPLTSEGMQKAFQLQLSRHVVGKIVIRVKA